MSKVTRSPINAKSKCGDLLIEALDHSISQRRILDDEMIASFMEKPDHVTITQIPHGTTECDRDHASCLMSREMYIAGKREEAVADPMFAHDSTPVVGTRSMFDEVQAQYGPTPIGGISPTTDEVQDRKTITKLCAAATTEKIDDEDKSFRETIIKRRAAAMDAALELLKRVAKFDALLADLST